MWRARCIFKELMLVELTRHQKEGEEFRQKMDREKVAFEQSMRSQGTISLRTTAHAHAHAHAVDTIDTMHGRC
jgi:hypothetical protein